MTRKTYSVVCPNCGGHQVNFTNNCPPYNRVREGCDININHVHYFCSCGMHIVTADNITKESRTAAGSLD
jgi:hypothetical protein